MIAAVAQATSAPPASGVGPGFLVAAAFVLIWRFALFRTGKGTIMGRLLAVLLVSIVGWALLAVTHPADATQLAAGTASGVAKIIRALATVLSGA